MNILDMTRGRLRHIRRGIDKIGMVVLNDEVCSIGYEVAEAHQVEAIVNVQGETHG